MRIDSHQHFWKYDAFRYSWIDNSMQAIKRDFLPEELKIILKRHDINGCIAVQAIQSEEETDFLLDLAENYEFIKGVVGWVDLCRDNIEERLSYYSRNKYFKGVRHILQSENDNYVLRKDFQNGISNLASFGLTYDLLVLPKQLKNILELTNKFPDQKFVLNHMAKPDIKNTTIATWATEINELSQHPKTYCKLSGFVTEADRHNWKKEDFTPYFDVVFEAFGAERLLFGSDWPVCLLAAQYDEVLEVVGDYIKDLSQVDQELISGVNAFKFYNLEK